MNPFLITTAVASGLVLLIAVLAMRQGSQITSMQELDTRWQKIDMQAFLNLVNPAEERYLRSRLPAAEFHRVQRMRVRAMWEYLGRLSFNSRLMMQAAQIVQHQSTGEQLRQATQIVAAASRMRLLIFAADAYLVIRFLLPQTQDPIRKLVADYDSLTRSFSHACYDQLEPARSIAG
jgi:hypothetical protein